MPVLTEAQRRFYENVLKQTKADIAEVNVQIEEECDKIRARVLELRAARTASKQMYAAACRRLEVPYDLEEDRPCDL